MNKSNQHIVFLTPGFATSENDSTTIPALQIYLKNLRQNLPLAKLTLLTFQYPFSKQPFNWNGIEVIPLNGKNKRWKKLYIWKKAKHILEKINLELPITSIHSFWIGECSSIGLKFSKKHKIKHITTVMGQDADSNNRYANDLTNTNTYIITLSKNQQDLLFKKHGLNTSIIPWSIDISSFPILQNKTIDILGVGSLNALKNYKTFINIIATLVQKHPNVKVEIIGAGIQRAALEKQIKELHLINNISLLGEIPREQVLEKMSKGKILLHTSSYESFGLVFLEALYSGMFIVSKNVGLARKIPSWSICDSQKEMIIACEDFLNHSVKRKERTILHSENESSIHYIKLYNG